MKRALALLALLGCSSPGSAPTPTPQAPPAPAQPAGVPPAVAVDGVPDLPKELRDRLAQYQAARGASFEDWGPDGAILISTRFAETSQLHLVPFPGGRREQLTFGEEPVAGAFWIPGTADLVYSQARGGDENYQIHRLDRKTGRSRLLTDGTSRNTMGRRSRRGDRVAFNSNRRNGRDMDLYTLDLATGRSDLVLEAKGAAWSVSDWSPDDRRLLLLKYVSVNDCRPYLLDAPLTAPHPVYPDDGPAFACSAARFGAPDSPLILTTDRHGEFRQLVRRSGAPDSVAREDRLDVPWDVVDVEVGPESIAVLRNEDGSSRLTLLGEERPLDIPVGVVSGLSVSPDGRRLGFTLSRPDAPGDVYTWEIAERKLVRWTFSEVGGLDPSTFVVPERIAYRSFDGREIPAYVYRPRGKKKAPVVVSIHGGPEGQSQPFFSPITQFHVNELGFAVIQPNVRGSTGYGKTFVALDNAEKREDSVKDIGALLDWIATQPGLDASRVAVTGGSYGGYMVLASLVHFGDRIKAGVDVVGIANFVTFLEKTSGYRVDLRRVEYGDERDPKMRAVFERISPANHAEKIRSALLVAHGRNDPRVPFFEAELIASKVRAQGRPVWTVYAANEGHGFARKENRDYLTAVTALFLKRHLLDEARAN